MEASHLTRFLLHLSHAVTLRGLRETLRSGAVEGVAGAATKAGAGDPSEAVISIVPRLELCFLRVYRI